MSGAAGFLEVNRTFYISKGIVIIKKCCTKVVYREICTEYAETIYSLQEKNVTDSEALLRLVS